MKRGRSLLILVAVPALVSLAVTVAALTLWDTTRPPDQRVVVLPTTSGTSMIAPLVTRPPGGGAQVASGETTSTTANQACQNPVHIVASGETLGAIATQYGVSMEDVVRINQTVDPNFNPDVLAVGQQLIIPACGIPTASPSPIPSDTPIPTRIIPTPIATNTEVPPGTISVKIARVLNAGDVTREAVEIVNQGSPVDLKGWKLSNGKGTDYLFPAFRLFTGGGVTILTGVGQDTPINLFWGLTSALWKAGETVFLYDDQGKLIDHLDVTQ